MIASIWNRRLVTRAQNIQFVNNVFCAFNANIDAKEYITAKKIKVAFLEDSELMAKVQESIKNPPDEIMCPADFFAGLYLSMRDGKSLQWEIREKNKEMLAWFEKYFEEADEKRIGGQSGIIANLLSILRVKCYIYVPLLSKQQAEEFRQKNILIPKNDGGMLKKVPIREGFNPNDDVKINWVFEYKTGTHFPIPLEGKEITAPRTNRFIVASRPQGLDPIFDKETEKILPELGTKVDKAILSGYQYLKPKYEDGTTLMDKLEICKNQIDLLRKKNKNLKIHVELAGIKNVNTRKGIVTEICKKVNSLGLNEVEIRLVLDILDAKKDSWRIKEDENAYSLYRGMLAIMEKLPLERIHIHNLGYHLLMLTKSYTSRPKDARDAILFASSVGSSRAIMGDFYSRDPLMYELGIGKTISISYTGLKQLEIVANKLKQDGVKCDLDDFKNTGILDLGDKWFIAIPTQIVANPTSTVGIGDTLSSTAFISDMS